MKISAKQQSTLDKVFALYNDSAAQQTEESAAAYSKLRTLCDKYKVDFDAYLESKGAKKPEEPKAEAPPEEPKPTAPKVVKSRRGYIIVLMREGVWDRASIAEAVAIKFPDYSDLKKNAQAVTGTIGDLRTNKGADIRVCETDGRILFKSPAA